MEEGDPKPIPDSEYFMEVDTVIQAISQKPDIDKMKADGFEFTRWDTFEVDEETLHTNVNGVFSAGDSVSGPATAIEAIVQGKTSC